MSRLSWSGLVVAAIAAAGIAVRAAGPTFWVTSTQADLLKGESDGVSIDELGRILAGPALTTTADLAAPQVWCLRVAPDGTWYAGTGGDGRVVRGRPGAAPDTLLDTQANGIYAIALAPDGRVYAASSPDGKVYVVNPDGTSRTFFDPAEKYIWALAVDATGHVWVGAGTPATLYRVDPDGTSHVVYRPPADHVVALAFDADGRVLAGTESPGRLYRIDANDHPFALLESDMAEVGAIDVAGDGTIYAAAVDAGGGSDSGGATTLASAASVPSASGSSSSTPSTPASAPKSAIFRVTRDGVSSTLWQTDAEIYDLAPGGDGTLLSATGPDGRIYRIRPDGSSVLVNAADAKQMTRIVRSGSGYVLASANPGRVWTLGTTPAASSSYLSPVHDASNVAHWGALRWVATAGVQVFTRTGNTDKPDESWSEWTGPYANPSGSAITSPPARYLQWKAVFSGSASPAASLTSVTIAYLPTNTRPEVTEVTVEPPGIVFQRPYSGDDSAVAGMTEMLRRPELSDAPPSLTGKKMYQKGLQTLMWKADDADDDRLQYALEYRREGETSWRPLASGLADPIYVWDTTTVPDGRYTVRVSASDAPSNPAARALTGVRESEAFEVDNTPPTMTTEVVRQNGAVHLHVRVHDTETPIDKVEYAIGGGPWTLVYPIDGLADSPDEEYDIPVASDADLGRLVLRASDVMRNVSTLAAVR